LSRSFRLVFTRPPTQGSLRFGSDF
jgi:hypothetical protein